MRANLEGTKPLPSRGSRAVGKKKKPNNSTKDPNISAKKPHISTKEPYISVETHPGFPSKELKGGQNARPEIHLSI